MKLSPQTTCCIGDCTYAKLTAYMTITTHMKKHFSAKLSWSHKTTAHPAFTIVELLVVIVVIGILAGVVIVGYNAVTGNAQASTAISSAASAANTIEKYKQNNSGNYPPDLTTAGVAAAPSGTTYSYTNTGTGYCFIATVSTISYYVTDANSQPIKGSSCPNTQNCPSGFIPVPGNPTFGTSNFCVMKYEAKQSSSTVPISQAAGLPWTGINQASAISYSANVVGCSGCHLITEGEWMTIAANVLRVASNWSGGSVGSGYIYSGHSDNAPSNALAADTNDANGYAGETNTGGNQRRTLTLTNGQVIWDFAGNVWEWTNATMSPGAQPGLSGDSGYTYKEWNNSSILWRSFPLSSRPSAISETGGASNYTSTQGIGQLYSYYSDNNTRGYVRGGAWYNTGSAGIFALDLSAFTTNTVSVVGFRVTD